MRNPTTRTRPVPPQHQTDSIASAEWDDGVVDELAAEIARHYPGMRGYTRPNLFRVRQFYEAYRENKKLSPLVRQLPWTHHLILLSQTKHRYEREFYMLAAIKGRWPKRELERQIQTGAALRSHQSARKVSPAVSQTHPTAVDEFKNAYSLEFLSLRASAGRIPMSKFAVHTPGGNDWSACYVFEHADVFGQSGRGSKSRDRRDIGVDRRASGELVHSRSVVRT